jgi:hypothetical protein
MLRNLSMNILVVSTMLFGLFKFIPNYMLLLIAVAFTLDAISLYFTTQKHGQYFYKRNPDLKKYIDIYLAHVLPKKDKDFMLFFIDRYLMATLLIVLYIYYFYKNGFCKIF